MLLRAKIGKFLEVWFHSEYKRPFWCEILKATLKCTFINASIYNESYNFKYTEICWSVRVMFRIKLL